MQLKAQAKVDRVYSINLGTGFKKIIKFELTYVLSSVYERTNTNMPSIRSYRPMHTQTRKHKYILACTKTLIHTYAQIILSFLNEIKTCLHKS